MKKRPRLRLVTKDHINKENRFLRSIIWFLRDELPEYLTRIFSYGWFIISLSKVSNWDWEKSPASMVATLFVIVYISCAILVLEGLYVLNDRHKFTFGNIRHPLFLLLTFGWPISLCLFAFMVAEFILRFLTTQDDDGDDDVIRIVK